MKRALGVLTLLFVAATQMGVYGGGGGGPATYGLSSSIQSNYPWAGTLEITIDDTPFWVADWLIDSLRVVNADSGLTNTPWEIHVTAGVNVLNPNGVNGFHGQDGTSGCDSGLVCRMTADQIRKCASSGLVEIAAHGYQHFSLSWDGTGYTQPATGDSLLTEDSGTWSRFPAGGTADSSMEQEIAGCYHYLADSLNLPGTFTFLCPNHRLSNYATYIMARYFYNCRGGLWQDGTTQWISDSSRTGGTNPARGIAHEVNPDLLDPMMFWWSNYASVGSAGNRFGQFMRGPTFQGSRLWIPNDPCGTTTAANAIAELKWAIALCAESKATMTWTWHRQDHDVTSLPPNLGGRGGVMQVFRAGAHYCRNGLLGREGPKLQFLTVNEGESKRLQLAHLAGPVNCFDNIRLLPDSACGTYAGGRASRPFGFAPACSTIWAARGWAYIAPDSVLKTAGWFSFDTNDSLDLTLRDSTRVSGIFKWSRPSGTTKPETLIVYVPVIPGSRVRAWCLASTSVTDSLGTRIAPPNFGDYASTDTIDVKITPFANALDPTDTTGTWATSVGLATSANTMVLPHSESNWASFGTRTYTGVPGESRVGYGVSGYAKARNAQTFHMADSWEMTHTSGWGQQTWAGDSLGTTAGRGWLGQANKHRAQDRWREFVGTADVPLNCGWAQVAFCPGGFSVSGACSLAVTGIEVQCSPR